MPTETTFKTLSRTRAGGKREHVGRKENEDRVLVREFTAEETKQGIPAVIVAVADGVSRCANGGGVAEWLLVDRMANDPIFGSETDNLTKQFQHYLREVHHRFLNDFRGDVTMLESGCTLSAVLLAGGRGSVFWAGDSPAYLLQKQGAMLHGRNLTTADKDPFSGALTDCFSGVTPFSVKLSGAEVKPGDILIAASDGVAFDVADLAATIDQHGFTENWLNLIVQASFEIPYSDDISLAGVEVPE